MNIYYIGSIPVFDELYHHGIQGQKWGVRNGPPYPIEDPVMKKGTKLNSISFLPNTAAGSEAYSRRNVMYAFRPDDEWDAKVYRGPFAYGKSLKSGFRMPLYEHEYETSRDLKMPTSNQRYDEFVKLAKEDKVTKKDLQKHKKLLEQYGPANNLSEAAKKVNPRKLSSEEDYKAAYEIFNRAMEMSNSYKSTKKYMEIMSTKYDAMVDDNNRGIYNDAHDPIIIFATNALKACGNLPANSDGMNFLKPSDITRNLNEVDNANKQSGRKTAL